MLILGALLSQNHALILCLQSIFGVNKNSAHKVCSIIGINPKTKLKQLNVYQLDKLKKVCRDVIDNTLFRTNIKNITFLMQLKHYRGIRHMLGLPARGQRTRTNAVTSKKVINKTLKLITKKKNINKNKFQKKR